MSRVTKLLGLSDEDVRNIGDAYAGYASFMQHNTAELAADSAEVETTAPWLASNWLMGGLLKSLVAPADAPQLFRNAAQVYRQLKHPFWKVAALCGLDEELLTMQEPTASYLPETTPNEYLYEQLRLSYLANNSSSAYHGLDSPAQQDTDNGALRLRRAGRLNLPLQLYVDALKGASSTTYQSINDAGNPLRALLYRAKESTELAAADTYHWQRLRGSVIPVEPELLAVCINVVKANRSGLEWLGDIQNPAYVPLMVAYNIVRSNEDLQRPRSPQR